MNENELKLLFAIAIGVKFLLQAVVAVSERDATITKDNLNILKTACSGLQAAISKVDVDGKISASIDADMQKMHTQGMN